MEFTPEELCAAFDAVERVRAHFPVLNPAASIEDMQRHVRREGGEREKALVAQAREDPPRAGGTAQEWAERARPRLAESTTRRA